MNCARCQGFMMSQTYEDLEDDTGQISLSAWRCFNCGEVVDPLILTNRSNAPKPIIGRARLNTPLSRLKLREFVKGEKTALTTASVGKRLF